MFRVVVVLNVQRSLISTEGIEEPSAFGIRRQRWWLRAEECQPHQGQLYSGTE